MSPFLDKPLKSDTKLTQDTFVFLCKISIKSPVHLASKGITENAFYFILFLIYIG